MEIIKSNKDFSALSERVAKSISKEIQFTMLFKSTGQSFKSFYEAEDTAKEFGFTVGSMARNEPIGIAKASAVDYVAKWYNIPSEARKELDGVLLSTDFRDGDVELVFFK